MRDCTAPIGPAVTYIYRSKHITGLGIQGNYQGNLYRYVYLSRDWPVLTSSGIHGSATTSTGFAQRLTPTTAVKRERGGGWLRLGFGVPHGEQRDVPNRFRAF
jgi:hypothetical protein